MAENLSPVPNRPSFPYQPCYPVRGGGSGYNYPQPPLDTIRIYAGSTLTLNLQFPFSLNGNIVSVVEASPDNLINDILIEPVDEYNLKLVIPQEVTATLPVHTKCVFRLGVTFPNGTQRNYNNIYIEVE